MVVEGVRPGSTTAKKTFGAWFRKGRRPDKALPNRLDRPKAPTALRGRNLIQVTGGGFMKRTLVILLFLAGGCRRPGAQGPQGRIGAMGNPGQPGANGTNGQSVVASSEPAGANCANGGVKLVSASGTSYACNGANGASGTNGQSVATATEPAGTNCANGGVQLTSASGKNYVCNGAAGAPGTPTAGLTVLDFEFDETSGTQFADSSGLGNNGVAMIGGIAVG